MSRLVLCGGGVAWLVFDIRAPVRVRTKAEDKAGVVFVEKLGGNVNRNDKRPGKPVVAVNLSRPKVTDANLRDAGGAYEPEHPQPELTRK